MRSLITAPPSVPVISLFFEKTLITFENIVQILNSLCHYDPWFMPIQTISHLSFSNNVTGRHIGANVKPFFRYSSFKICPNLSKMCSNDLRTEPHRSTVPDFFAILEKKSYDVANLTSSTQHWFRGCNLWTVCHKIIKLVSIDSLHHVESDDIYFARIGCTTS
jgi:hypothetical protein